MNWLTRQSRARPHAVALRVGQSDVTWRMLEARAEGMAAALNRVGVRRGARVAALAANGPSYVTLLYAAMWTGASIVALDPRHPDARLSEQLLDADADLLVIDQSAANRSLDLGHLRFVQLEELTYSHGIEPTPMRPDDLATLVYTSGATGPSKLVRLTWRNHEASALANGLNLGIDPDDDWLCCLPLCHVGGLSILLRSVIYGSAVTLLETFEPDEVLEHLRGRVSIVSLVPTMLRRLVERLGSVAAFADHVSAGRLRAILLGGAAVDDEFLAECVEAGLPVIPTYGMTETASQIATLPPDRVVDKAGSVGLPVWNADIEIRTPEGEPVDDGPGVVWVSGPMVTSGYLDSPAENRRRFVAGWFRTNDWGELDEEGFLHVHGRHDDVIVTGGENVSPGPVEEVIARHPRVRDVAVFGLPDREWGNRVAAAIVTAGPISTDELSSICRDELARYQMPRDWFVVDELPRTSLGKVERGTLTERFSALTP